MFKDVSPLLTVHEAPRNLRGIGQKKWVSTAKLLVNRRVLTSLDLDTLESYSITYQNIEQARAELEQGGTSLVDPDTDRVQRNPNAALLQGIMREQQQRLQL